MSDIPIYGLDKELADKAQSKYDPKREAEAREWIEAVVGEPFASNNFQESLKDGVLLAKLALKVIPGTTFKPNVSKMPFKQMENINYFLQALDKVGVPKQEQFQTIDLFEGKNMNQVVDSIFSLSRHAVKAGFTGPLLGPKLHDKREMHFSDEQLKQGKNIIGLQMGYAGGANASGVSFGSRREIGGRDPNAR
ncbi:calponin homology domain-containing protein [Entophlyctis helioformis]|nr:calponin homology domain-containing protein [Entophlyctis helioformis]